MDNRLTQTIGRLAGNLSHRPHLPRLAREIQISVRTLESLFKLHTGQPFASFYRELRIAEAKSLLVETNTPVKVIAISLGYRAVEVFCRDFKRANGCTAIEYRLRSRRERLQKKSIESC